MNTVREFFYLLGYQDFETFSNVTNLVIIIYLLSFSVLFLENGVILAFFLPGDTLLIFLGILVAKDVLNFPLTLGILTIASGLGSWFSYFQGQWLKCHKLTKRYFIYVPERYRNLADKMFNSYGLCALFISRFIVVLRTLFPVVVGLSKVDTMRFHFFNWISAFFWILILTLLGFFIGKTECIQGYEKQFLYYVMLIFFIVSIFVTIVQCIRKVLLRGRI